MHMSELNISKSQFFETRKQHVVMIRKDEDQTIVGGGVFVSRGRIVLTAAHLLLGDTAVIVVRHDGKKLDFSVIFLDVKSDLAALEVANDDGNSATSLSYANLEISMPVQYIGHSGGLEYCYNSSAYVSIPSRQVRDIYLEKLSISKSKKRTRTYDDFESISSFISVAKVKSLHGCGRTGGTGAPTFDFDGKIMGIYSFMFRDGDYVIPAVVIRQVLEEFSVTLESGDGSKQDELVGTGKGKEEVDTIGPVEKRQRVQ